MLALSIGDKPLPSMDRPMFFINQLFSASIDRWIARIWFNVLFCSMFEHLILILIFIGRLIGSVMFYPIRTFFVNRRCQNVAKPFSLYYRRNLILMKTHPILYEQFDPIRTNQFDPIRTNQFDPIRMIGCSRTFVMMRTGRL